LEAYKRNGYKRLAMESNKKGTEDMRQEMDINTWRVGL
jgi:hypothetical protein